MEEEVRPGACHTLVDVVLQQTVEVHDAESESNADGSLPEYTPREAEADRPSLANVYSDPVRHTVTLLLDEVTANTVIYAIRVLAADSEAHAREVRLVGATMPADSYGATNRHVIALRDERIAQRLRVLESNYRDVVTTPIESLKNSSRRRRRH